MSLPVITYPAFDVTMPCTNKRVTFRPFTVAEERIMLLNKGGGENFTTIKQIISNCCLDRSFDAGQMSMVDMEYTFVQLRKQSVSDKLELVYGNTIVEAKLSDVKYDPGAGPIKTVTVSDRDHIAITMARPSIDDMIAFEEIQNTNTSDVDLIRTHIKSIDQNGHVTEMNAVPPAEAVAFIESFPLNAMREIEDWLQHAPELYLEVTTPSGKVQRLTGIASFFQS